MTQEDLQRDVERLDAIRDHMHETMDSCGESFFAAIDRAIETARVLASMSDRQRSNIAGHCEAMATAHESPGADDDRGSWADAHRKVARLMGGRDG